ncbi:MurR/RpiR family transcriptional regulator, partial [Thomasclavelia sp.]|uniref:MurR/RpiR family transcriptional regulator n=1 Tax=Thomasclavelia sp. TaxID=3025757 RepID=UPI00345D8A49
MLIQERLERCDFSTSEKVIIDFILKEKMKIKNMTTKDIANATFTSPSTLIRIAHKMKFNGWNELKDAYLKEIEYLQSHFLDVDANYPFTNEDTI